MQTAGHDVSDDRGFGAKVAPHAGYLARIVGVPRVEDCSVAALKVDLERANRAAWRRCESERHLMFPGRLLRSPGTRRPIPGNAWAPHSPTGPSTSSRASAR